MILKRYQIAGQGSKREESIGRQKKITLIMREMEGEKEGEFDYKQVITS